VRWWLAVAVDPRLRSKTAADYRAHLARYLLQSIGAIRLRELQPLDVQSVYAELLDRGLSPRTIRYTHAILHGALEHAMNWKLISENPVSGLTLPRIERREIRVLTPEEARRFATAAANHSDGLVLMVALATGLRPGEYLALRRDDFDLERSTFTIQRTLERVKPANAADQSQPAGRWQFTATKRQLGRRTVAIPVEVSARVAALLDRQGILFQQNSLDNNRGEGLIFQTPRGKPIHERNLVQRVFKPL